MPSEIYVYQRGAEVEVRIYDREGFASKTLDETAVKALITELKAKIRS